MGGFEITRERIELRLPGAAVALDPCRGAFHRAGGEPAAVDAAVNFAVEKSRRLEDTQMLRDRRQRHREGIGQLGHRRFAPREARQDGATRRVGQRSVGGVQDGR